MTDLGVIPEAALGDLRRRYAEPQRHYHTWAHIEALLRWYDEQSHELARPDAVLHAILFHDAIYDPARSDNEEASAELLRDAEVELSEADRRWVDAAILATKTHTLPDPANEDVKRFLDMDLSILGAREDVFDRYEDQVRAEYAHVPEPMFRAGRAAILKRFLDRDRLYFSDWGHERFELPARANLTRSIAKLTDGATS